MLLNYSSGFAVSTAEDNEIEEDGKSRPLGCGTEKEKHKCANRQTAGVLFFWGKHKIYLQLFTYGWDATLVKRLVELSQT